MRRRIAAGNWKMNKRKAEALELASTLAQSSLPGDVEVILAVPSLYLEGVQNAVHGSTIQVAAQNCHQEDFGAYTGEISAPMLASINVAWVIIGHSERRQYFAEDNALLAKKVDKALEHNLRPIFCCGEPLNIREKGNHVAFVKTQLQESLFHLDEKSFGRLVIAYEPIWAIGTGVTASPEQAQDMHREIRSMITNQYDSTLSEAIQILYGGSVKPANARILFDQPDVDGGLVGGASLKSGDFLDIINA